MSTEDRVSHFIVIDTFVVHSESVQLYIPYAISLDLHRRYKHRLTEDGDDDRFVQVKSLDVRIHYGAFCSIVYTVEFGRGYRLPRIVYNASV